MEPGSLVGIGRKPTVTTPGSSTPSRRPLREFIHDELTGGLVLLATTVASLVWANVGSHSYEKFWGTVIGPSGPLNLNLSLHQWVNDALMAIFFSWSASRSNVNW